MQGAGQYIFISYASEDAARVKVLADALQASGWSVWWDREIPTGRDYQQVIEAALDGAACVVVAWSGSSVSSTWVKAEADAAREQHNLVPVMIEQAKLPVVFRMIQTADLSNWDGDRNDPTFQKLLKDIGKLVQPSDKPRPAPTPPQAPAPPSPTPPGPSSPISRYLLGAVALLVVAVGGKLAFDHFAAPPVEPGPTPGEQDTDAPQLVVHAPDEGSVVAAGEVTVSGYVFDESESLVYVNGGRAELDGTRWSHTLQTFGDTLEVRITAEDAHGNRTAAIVREHAVADQRDTTPPDVTFDHPPVGAAIEPGKLRLSGTVSDASTVALTVNGRRAQVDGQNWTHELAVETGRVELTIEAVDAAGNSAEALHRVFEVRPPPDTTPPHIALDQPASGQAVEEGMTTFSGRYDDETPGTLTVGNRVLRVEPGPWSTDLILAAGRRTVTISAEDDAGNLADPIDHIVDVQRRSVLELLPAESALALYVGSPADLHDKLRGSIVGSLFEYALRDIGNSLSRSGIVLDRLLNTLQGELAIWAGDVSWVDGHTRPDFAALPLILVGDALDARATLERDFQRFLRTIRREERRFRVVEEALHDGRRYVLNFGNDDFVVHVATRGSRYFVSTNSTLLNDTVARDARSLELRAAGSAAELFARARDEGQDLVIHASLDELQQQWLPADPLGNRAPRDEYERERAERQAEKNARLRVAARVLRGRSWHSAQAGLSINEEIRLSLLLGGTRSRDGLLAALDATPLQKQGLQNIHGPVDAFFSLGVNLEHLAHIISEVMDAMNSDEAHDSLAEWADGEFGVNLRPLIPALGDQLHLSTQGIRVGSAHNVELNPASAWAAVRILNERAFRRAFDHQVTLQNLERQPGTADRTIWTNTLGHGFVLDDKMLEAIASFDRFDGIWQRRQKGALLDVASGGLPEQANALLFASGALLRDTISKALSLDRNVEAYAFDNALKRTVEQTGPLIGHAHWEGNQGYELTLRLLRR